MLNNDRVDNFSKKKNIYPSAKKIRLGISKI